MTRLNQDYLPCVMLCPKPSVTLGVIDILSHAMMHMATEFFTLNFPFVLMCPLPFLLGKTGFSVKYYKVLSAFCTLLKHKFFFDLCVLFYSFL